MNPDPTTYAEATKANSNINESVNTTQIPLVIFDSPIPRFMTFAKSNEHKETINLEERVNKWNEIFNHYQLTTTINTKTPTFETNLTVQLSRKLTTTEIEPMTEYIGKITDINNYNINYKHHNNTLSIITKDKKQSLFLLNTKFTTSPDLFPDTVYIDFTVHGAHRVNIKLPNQSSGIDYPLQMFHDLMNSCAGSDPQLIKTKKVRGGIIATGFYKELTFARNKKITNYGSIEISTSSPTDLKTTLNNTLNKSTTHKILATPTNPTSNSLKRPRTTKNTNEKEQHTPTNPTTTNTHPNKDTTSNPNTIINTPTTDITNTTDIGNQPEKPNETQQTQLPQPTYRLTNRFDSLIDDSESPTEDSAMNEN